MIYPLNEFTLVGKFKKVTKTDAIVRAEVINVGFDGLEYVYEGDHVYFRQLVAEEFEDGYLVKNVELLAVDKADERDEVDPEEE